MRYKQIFKAFSENIAYLIYSDNPTFHEHNDVQGKRFISHSKKIQQILRFGKGKKYQSQLQAFLPNHLNSIIPVN